MKRTALVWLTTNLRLHDNPPLVIAIEQNIEVVPVYCLDINHFKRTSAGFYKTGQFRARFILEALSDLDANLRAVGSGLVVVTGQPEVELCKIAEAYGANTVYTQSEFASEELITQEKVERALTAIGCCLEKIASGDLYSDDDLPFTLENTPDIFTNYRKAVEQRCKVPEPVPAPTIITSPPIAPLQLPTLQQLGLEEFTIDVRQAFVFTGGETSGLQRVHEYLFESRSILSYKQTRNGLTGSNYSSKFSAWLASGCISSRQVYQSIKNFEVDIAANESTYWLYFELLWRDYFRLVMKKYGTRLFHLSGIKQKITSWPVHNPALLKRWIQGETGNDFIDANMLELRNTGFMSNRGRQNVASYFCHDLKMDWRLGAAYFEQQLIDYDVCSNWGNWAYVAGVGNDPRPNRYFNIDKQANDYDADKSYRKLWIPVK